MFDTYSMSPQDLWEQVAEMKRRGIPVPPDLQDRLDIVKSEGGFTEVDKEGGPPFNPLNQGGFFDPEDPAQSIGAPPAKSGPSRGHAPVVPVGFGEAQGAITGGKAGSDPRANIDRMFKKAAAAVYNMLPGGGEKRIESDDPLAGVPSAAWGGVKKVGEEVQNVADAVAYPIQQEFQRSIRDRNDPASTLPGAYPGISKGEIRDLGLRGPEDPDRPLRDYDKRLADLVEGAKAGLARATGNTDKFGFPSKSFGVLQSDEMVGPMPEPPKSVRESVSQPAAPRDPTPDVRQGMNPTPRINDEMYNNLVARPNMTAPKMTDDMNPVEDPGFFEKGGGLLNFLGGLNKNVGFGTPGGQALMAAGLGMMSAPGTYGNFGQALGKGGLMGLNTYQEAQKQEDLNKYKREALDYQKNASRDKNALEAFKIKMESGGKIPDIYVKQMENIKDMVKNGQIEEAKKAYSNSVGLQTYYPDFVPGRQKTEEERLGEQLDSNPAYARDYYNNKAGLNKNSENALNILRKRQLDYIDGKGPPLSEDEQRYMRHLEQTVPFGTAAGMVDKDPMSVILSPEERMQRTGQIMPEYDFRTARDRAPKPKPAAGLSPAQQKFAQGVAQKMRQELGRDPDPQELAARLEEEYNRQRARGK